MMSLMNVVRIAKVLALLAFVLPWAAVSCQGTDLVTASGIEMIQGKMSANPDAERQINERMGRMFGAGPGDLQMSSGARDPRMENLPNLGTNYFGIAAAAVIVIGLLASFVGATKTAARNVLVTSLLGMALCFGTVWWWKQQVQKQDGGAGSSFGGAESSAFGGGGFGGGMGDQLLQERFGYWIALSALAVAAGAGAIGMAAGGAAAVRKEPEPPAA